MIAGRYSVGPLIGRGGMADVHLGTDSRLGRTVAIKLLKSTLATDPAFRTRFRQEAQAAARMAHPTIVRVFDAGEETVIEENGRYSGMAVAYNECASIDPYLPPELLPRPWPGRAARNLIVRYRRLALMLRAEAGPPALFRLFDKMILQELR